MLKAAKKKLKFWTKNKKRKKIHNPYLFPPPPPPCHCCNCCCSSSSAVQPSAPPLPPPWLDDPTTPTFPQSELHPDQEAEIKAPVVAVAGPSYQQYMAPNPIYGVAIMVEKENSRRRERSIGVFGCVGDLWIRFIQCLCPCFRIPEPSYYIQQ